jgi:hypothetical protein
MCPSWNDSFEGDIAETFTAFSSSLACRCPLSKKKNGNDNDVFRLVEANSSDDDGKSILLFFAVYLSSYSVDELKIEFENA